MNIRDFNPADGMAFQGDVAIVPIPDNIKIATTDEIKPIEGRLILQEGELTGHHHAITLLERPALTEAEPQIAPVKASRAAQKVMADALANKITVPTAKLYRDPAAVQAMVRADILARADLAVACLVVEGGPMVVSHEEHDGIRLPVGRYYVGRQVESAGAEERRVAD
jgi:hypothetical protein